MNLLNFENLEKESGLYGEVRRIKPLFEVTKKELKELEKEELRIFFLAVLQGQNEGQILQLKVTIDEEKEFLIVIKFYGYETVLEAIQYLNQNCRCF